MKYLTVFLVLALVALSTATEYGNSNVVSLTDSSFSSKVGGAKPVFVKFYLNGCPHCIKLDPIFLKLADTFFCEQIDFAQVNGQEKISDSLGIKGFPSLQYFPANSRNAEEYKGNLDLDSLVSFVNGKLGKTVAPALNSNVNATQANAAQQAQKTCPQAAAPKTEAPKAEAKCEKEPCPVKCEKEPCPAKQEKKMIPAIISK